MKAKKVTLRPSRDFTVRRRHPWIFSGALADEVVDVGPGETVEVVDARGKRLGYGSYRAVAHLRSRWGRIPLDIHILISLHQNYTIKDRLNQSTKPVFLWLFRCA